MEYQKHFATRETPQSEKIPGSKQVENSAGGYAFAVDDWRRLDRFLVLGSEGGSYYASEKKLTAENAEAVRRCILSDGPRAVRRIAEVSKAGRAPKNDPAIFALAMAAGLGSPETRRAALDALPEVCRIGTHLFHFAAAVEAFRGWGRGLRTAVANWYLSKTPEQLAVQVAKYQQRDGWSHRDLLRLSSPRPATEAQQAILRWAVKADFGERKIARSRMKEDGKESIYSAVDKKLLPRIIQGMQVAAPSARASDAAKLVRDYKLPRECVPTEWLAHAEVWDALLEDMLVMAMVRNLGNMSKVGLLSPMSEAAKIVCAKLGDAEQVRRSRIHPVQVLVGLRTYAAGKGLRGSGAWTPVPQVIDALDGAYYKAFESVEPTGKRFYLGLDISGSMWGGEVAGISNFPPAEAAGALAMVTVKTEKNYYCAGFTAKATGSWRNSTEMTPVPLSPKQRLDDILGVMSKLTERMGGTDCALPMIDALERKIPVDVFCVFTDSETWAGGVHPAQALRQYREKTGIPAKLAVVGLVSNGFSIADPDDAGMMDVVGFSTDVPTILGDFARQP